MGSRIKVDTDGPILRVRIDYPEKLNALDAQACADLGEAWARLEADPALRVAVLSGEGRGFCAGHDLNDHKNPLPASGFGGLTQRRGRTKPIVGAAHGFVLGGGLEMLLACDVIVADETTTFALPEMRYGAAAMAGGLQRLVRRLPAAVAFDILLTGRSFDAAEAERWGLLSRLVPPGQAPAAAREIAEAIAANAPLGVQYTLRAAYEALDGAQPLFDVIDRQMQTYLPILKASRDSHEGLAAFAERRAPVWSGS